MPCACYVGVVCMQFDGLRYVTDETLQGCFEVRSAQPVSYVIEEMEGLLNPANKACAP